MTIKDRLRNILYRQIFPRGGLQLLKLISRTYCYRLVDTENEQRVLDDTGTVVYASWHQRFLPGLTTLAARKPIAIIVSQSNDGEIIARVADALGWHPVRGSSTRGGMRALKEIRTLARQGFRFGHIVDGPQGPFGVVKPGLLTIAQLAGAPIVPVITSAQRRWVFNSWDRFMVPKPFSKILVRFGPPMAVPRRLAADAFESLRQEMENRIKELYTETDNWWRDAKIVERFFP
jgi:lysophospholipid acyltransferase (LPLAT)-like uncharacterized protein